MYVLYVNVILALYDSVGRPARYAVDYDFLHRMCLVWRYLTHQELLLYRVCVETQHVCG